MYFWTENLIYASATWGNGKCSYLGWQQDYRILSPLPRNRRCFLWFFFNPESIVLNAVKCLINNGWDVCCFLKKLCGRRCIFYSSGFLFALRALWPNVGKSYQLFMRNNDLSSNWPWDEVFSIGTTILALCYNASCHKHLLEWPEMAFWLSYTVPPSLIVPWCFKACCSDYFKLFWLQFCSSCAHSWSLGKSRSSQTFEL